ncbi:MAG: LytTR family transcriptional regulator [Treponema sp.]|nr:LytTR family transcriptional regulator [Treponema sp.]
MKITILENPGDEEDEIIVKCKSLDDSIIALMKQLKNGSSKINLYKDGQIRIVERREILYFEYVEGKVFAYTENEVFDARTRLYELEELLPASSFFRANKAVILNIDQVDSLAPAFGGRFEAVLRNGYRAIISRNYVPALKEILGLEQ